MHNIFYNFFTISAAGDKKISTGRSDGKKVFFSIPPFMKELNFQPT